MSLSSRDYVVTFLQNTKCAQVDTQGAGALEQVEILLNAQYYSEKQMILYDSEKKWEMGSLMRKQLFVKMMDSHPDSSHVEPTTTRGIMKSLRKVISTRTGLAVILSPKQFDDLYKQSSA